MVKGNKKNTVKMYNKGLRKIEAIEGMINPQEVFECNAEEAKKLINLFESELVIVAEGENPLVAKDNDSAKCAALKKEVIALEKKIADIQKSDNAQIVEDLQKENEGLKEAVESQKSALQEESNEKEELVKSFKKANAEIAKLKR